jgi:carbamoyl-phosphate synthase small subunit
VPSSWRSVRTLDDELKAQGVVGISGIDTRALTRHLRERGAMRVGISSTTTDTAALLDRVRASGEMAGSELSSEVSTAEAYVVPALPGPWGEKRLTVAALDLGIKTMTPHRLAERGIETHVLPATATHDDLRATGADGLFYSNGPGDPAATTDQVALLQAALADGTPYFGICFGNQLFGRALGFGTYKLKYGHRGANQPVTDGVRTWITTQNHGYAVDTESMQGIAHLSFRNANDQSCEGLEYPGKRCFTVQFHPEACAGPHDTEFLFDRFLRMMRGEEA